MTAPKNDKPTPLDDSPQARAARLAMTFVGFLDMITALASPRIMATIAAIPLEEQPKFLTSVDAFLEMVPDFPHEKARAAEASIHELRALLATWTPGSVVPVEIQSKARIVLTAFRVPEPPEGWDRFEGAPDAPPAERPAPRVLRSEPMTIEEWVTWQGPGELVDGVLVEEEETTPEHDAVVNRLLEALRAWAEAHGAVVRGPKEKLVIGDRTGRKPDIIVYWSNAPELVVEVQSMRKVDIVQDLATKPSEYARFGISRLWLVDPAERHLTRMRLLHDGRGEVLGVHQDGKHAMQDIEGLVLDLDALWPKSKGS